MEFERRSFIAGALAVFLAPIKARALFKPAAGGSIPDGAPILVGEQCSELFIPTARALKLMAKAADAAAASTDRFRISIANVAGELSDLDQEGGEDG